MVFVCVLQFRTTCKNHSPIAKFLKQTFNLSDQSKQTCKPDGRLDVITFKTAESEKVDWQICMSDCLYKVLFKFARIAHNIQV